MEQNHMLARPTRVPAQQQPLDEKFVGQGPPPTLSSLTTHKLHLPSKDIFSHNQKHLPLHLHPDPRSPPSYTQSHEPSLLSFPDVPNSELAPIQPHGDVASGANNTLPSLSSVTGPQPSRFPASKESPYSPPQVDHWPSLNPLSAYYTPSHVQAAEPPQRMDVDMISTSTMSAASPDRYYDARAGSVSLDDPDVRMAAEALGDLRADFVSSPPNRSTPLPGSPTASLGARQQSEPLLSLLTTSHPLLATTIEGATSAYNTSKNFSPRFKSGAEYVEGYLTPIANTVGSVGRVTGVEGGMRWFLRGGRRHQSSDAEADSGSHKRRKVDVGGERALDAMTDRISTPDRDIYSFTKERRTSMSTVDTLPAYDDHRSPAYSESVEPQSQITSRPSSSASAAWQHRLIMSTSGLSIAMSEESLRSLKYCLNWLRWANDHMGKVIDSLKATLEQYNEQPSISEKQGLDHVMNDSPASQSDLELSAEDRGVLADRIKVLRSDVLKTLRDVIETVSKYAGGALPDNARTLVRRHLTSLPQRFKLASMQDPATTQDEKGAQEKELRDGARRVLVLAKEGLDMMAQVSGVLDGTIVSAEEWCERLGKKKKEERERLTGEQPTATTQPLISISVDADIKMG